MLGVNLGTSGKTSKDHKFGISLKKALASFFYHDRKVSGEQVQNVKTIESGFLSQCFSSGVGRPRSRLIWDIMSA